MDLDRSLLKEFAKITNDSEAKAENKYLRGTIVSNGGGKYVQIDGSSTITPISELIEVEEGDRVLVSIENHKATIVGNFTFPPSARKEQEALDKANTAQGTANGANETANAAQQKAQEASDKADEAFEQSSIASASADEAKQQASEAIGKANEAQENIQEAKDLATEANTNSTEAKQLAASSQAASADAQAEVTRLQGEVDTAKENIDKALEDLEAQAEELTIVKNTYSTKVETENAKAELSTEIDTKIGSLQTTIEETYATKTENVELEGRLQSQITANAEGLTVHNEKIEKVEADTAEAQKDVATALANASAAQTAANTAQSKADEAKSAADQATSDAQAADEKATLARNAADQAIAAADAADKAVQEAQGDLDEAKQNLASVTSRVDATEADIADAQAKVDAAQLAVNEALADAAEANNAANIAQEAANKAQQDAETAQGIATSAQQKAENAQTAANQATEKAEKAQEDVAALTSRVTKAETDIIATNEQISLNASKTEEIGVKVDNLKVGARNLLLGTGEPLTVDGSIDTYGRYYYSIEILEKNQEYIFSADVEILSGNVDAIEVRISNYNTESRIVPIINNRIETTLITSFSSFSYIILYPGERTTDNTGNIVKFSNAKLEKGNISTDWTPAPEDLENNLNDNYYKKTETDALLKVESDRISSTVTRVETVEKDLDDLEVGGRNLLLNSSFTVNSSGWWGDGITDFVEIDGKTCAHIKSTELGYTLMVAQSMLERIEPNTTYTMSGWVRTDNITSGNTDFDIMFYQDGRYDNGGVDTWYGYGVKWFPINTGEGTWHYLTWTFTTDNTIKYAHSFDIYVHTRDYTGDVYFYNLKLEKGTKATDWTPAPEDTSDAISNAQSTADDAKGATESLNNSIIAAQSSIQQLSDMIANLVVDQNGVSQMTQTSTGWQFDLASINGNLNAVKDAITNTNTDLSTTKGLLDSLTSTVNGIAQKTAYITLGTDDSGNPCIELGKYDNDFKVRITNTAIDFLQGKYAIATANNNIFRVDTIRAEQELQIINETSKKGFAWRVRENGNMGLVPITV